MKESIREKFSRMLRDAFLNDEVIFKKDDEYDREGEKIPSDRDEAEVLVDKMILKNAREVIDEHDDHRNKSMFEESIDSSSELRAYNKLLEGDVHLTIINEMGRDVYDIMNYFNTEEIGEVGKLDKQSFKSLQEAALLLKEAKFRLNIDEE